jgi:hypothetical protein
LILSLIQLVVHWIKEGKISKMGSGGTNYL